MSQPESTSQNVLPTWVESSLIKGMLRGIERESLRMQSDGFLSQAAHPRALGSALTHPHITTDYSEALMEFITPPQDSIKKALDYLSDIHAIVHRHLENDEKLWPLSMPCMLDSRDDSIPLAQYGSSNIGLFKTLYRHGLGVRYGRRMQTISGVHYNLSFPDHLFEALQQQEQDEALKALSLQDYRSHRYMGLIRNFIRLTPLVMFLIGASPAVCQCFMTGRDHFLLPLVKGTLYSPYATALRMGRFGYQNSAQKQLGIHYNNLQDYLDGLQKAVKTPYKPFSRLGLDDANGQPIQINDHVLQIENEYYSLVRPKQVPLAGETPSQALENRGIAYVELRAVDVNPYSPIGINEDTAGFLEVVALYCLLQDSPALLSDEQDIIEQNQAEVVNRGRAPNAAIMENGQSYPIEDWCAMHLQHMHPLAKLLNSAYDTTLYTDALKTMRIRVDEVDATLSALVVGDTREQGSMWHFGQHLAQQHSSVYEAHQLSPETLAYFEEMSQKSLQQQQQLEQDSSVSFADYLAQYR
ncbi:glutamate--cysteine ligase [Acinetobacter lwoffii]|jgi:glutamate--cysteine ligase|uniref:Glutamate--cysteine ligase n=1 Tax=Acinetobacter lwoffii NCTC 5866 = CIP 64.10 = NIPH 512 TaxID=981327 RepID=A0ABN0PV53_ACILW|nr:MULTISPECIES: glutamate--cysteine ligase [Acinetobacter]ENU15400.1 glutamate-cysteine ligase [Acinetobacter sp. CIP A162]ESJ94398.1 glutamate-cysteine ligase [Acinetobacter lwoffii NCTC 5866 = CIP 64.10 = NIPH 512]MCU4438819.1 glutamate--cysteine ligase [Acinetobacter lwoffii]OIU86925.1 glutamate--cysteine ligase [Acinetobacter sp. AR2-3]QXB41643.1 glutamate--cysteine ligase [Acinetobacter lwoffii]